MIKKHLATVTTTETEKKSQLKWHWNKLVEMGQTACCELPQ